jgi:hypothetical protein
VEDDDDDDDDGDEGMVYLKRMLRLVQEIFIWCRSNMDDDDKK